MKAQAGFTFLELMLAATIFAIMAVAVYATLGSGIAAWKTAAPAENLYQDLRLALDRMTQDLENAVLYFSETEEDFFNFSGREHEISFYALEKVVREIPPHPQLKKITYNLDDSVQILKRRVQDYPDAEQAMETEEAEEIAMQVKSLDFFYCYEEDAQPPYTWKRIWASPQEIPQGIRIELELATEEEPVFIKYVFIPTGRKGQASAED